MTNQTYAGIDVGKENLDLNIHGEAKVQRFSNNSSGIRALVQYLAARNQPHVVMEASGGYERLPVQLLRKSGLVVSVVNPTLVRRFAQGMGTMAKTDAIDASVIAHYAAVKQPREQTQRSKDEENLVEAMDRREQLIAMLTMEKNRLSNSPASIHANIQSHINFLNQQIQELDTVVDELVAQNAEWQEKMHILTSFKGVGKVVALTLLAEMPELGFESRECIGALAGVAPINKDSGKKKGKRKTMGGRAKVRRVLFMSALSSVRSNPAIMRFYERLLLRGKEKKVALVACMHKILTILNAMLRKNEVWNPNYS
jgi:transposase